MRGLALSLLLACLALVAHPFYREQVRRIDAWIALSRGPGAS
jgi:hypothetical protein